MSVLTFSGLLLILKRLLLRGMMPTKKAENKYSFIWGIRSQSSSYYLTYHQYLQLETSESRPKTQK